MLKIDLNILKEPKIWVKNRKNVINFAEKHLKTDSVSKDIIDFIDLKSIKYLDWVILNNCYISSEKQADILIKFLKTAKKKIHNKYVRFQEKN